ncbi:endonuclease V [Streptomyces sp. N2-109]|uniref:Endonuclease V n=1 Tax=Streptomyces gossypii TaxID=2883101 RepID=A0ABT2K076_9ACTN|nr:endonuclease V [Streptomyces gossypii]MCT2593555.1 endonuclease V [Streptomyces gossypii]
MAQAAQAAQGPQPGWPVTEAEALAVQDQLRARVEYADHSPVPGAPCTLVAGVDVAYDDERDLVAAAAVVLDAATLEVVAQATALAPVSFPYVPGLLAFREIPAVLAALEQLGSVPGLVVCDGYGMAHPRRFGLASHLGVLTGLPTIGVAKSPFLFRHAPVGERRGDSAPLLDEGRGRGECGPDGDEGGDEGGEEVGRALRTREGVKPVYVSVGHRTGLDAACAHTLALARHYRLPETTRRADALCRTALRAAQGT